MNFNEYVEKKRDSIHSIICSYVKMVGPKGHHDMVRDYVDRQGGYRRPGLLLLSAELFGADPEDALLPAAAMQLSEDWLLIHDDIEDNSELRRGKPTLHKIYGMELALNAGDAAHLVMWKMVGDTAFSVPKRIGKAMYNMFYDMLEKTAEGQYIENNFILNTRKISGGSESLYNTIIAAKSVYYSVYGPLQLGAIFAGAKASQVLMLKRIGEPAGMAFQIMDDVLDMTADEKAFGKQKYGDLYEGKLTLIALHAYEHASPAERERMDAIYSKRKGQKSKDEILWLANLMEKNGSIDYARTVAEKYGSAAAATMEKYRSRLPNNEFTDIFVSALAGLYKRSK